jgi:hypothetical protein
MRKSNKKMLYKLLLLCSGLFIVYIVCTNSRYEGFTKTIRTKGIILRSIGGLGNQLFIYATALLFKKTFNIDVFIIKDASTNTHSDRDYRFLMRGMHPLEETDPIFMHAREFNFSENYPYYNYNENEIPVDDTSYIKIGIYDFQVYKKIRGVIDEVRESVVSKCKELYNNIGIHSDSSAFIHVRRGDYLTDLDGKRMISPEFYKNALEILNKSENINVIYIFSDDIPWCKEQIWNTSKKLLYYDDPDELKTLYMMSQCWAGAVISNSTFSLWGVFLGAYEKTNTIVYPTNEYFLKDLPDSWIKI